MNKFILNSSILIASALFIKILTSSFEIYVANLIGAEAVGIFSIIMSIYSFGITLATSGIHLATTKIISEELEKGNKENIRKVLFRSIIYSLILGSITFILAILFAPYICDTCLKGKIDYIVIYILGLSFPFVSLTSGINGYFMAVRKVFKNSLCQVTSQIIRILLISLTLSYVFPKTLNYAILSLVLGSTLSEIFYFIFLYIMYKKDSKKYVTHANIQVNNLTKRLLKISIPIAITSYVRSFLSTLKQILIPIRLKLYGMDYTTAVANYGIITGMALPVIMFSSVIVYSYSSLLVPEFSRYTVVNKDNTMEKNICKLFKITLYFSICVTGILMYFGNDIGTTLFKAPKVGYYIKIIAPLIPLMYLDNVVDNILKGLGKQVSVMICNIVDLVISLSFIYFLLPRFGIIGFVIVMYISEILNYTVSVITLFKTTNVKFKYFDWVLFPIFAISIAIFLNSLFKFTLSFTTTLVLNILITITFYLFIIFLKENFKKFIKIY